MAITPGEARCTYRVQCDVANEAAAQAIADIIVSHLRDLGSEIPVYVIPIEEEGSNEP